MTSILSCLDCDIFYPFDIPSYVFFSLDVFGGKEVPTVYILLCRPSEDSLQQSAIPDGSLSKDRQSTVGWGDCCIWSFTIWCYYLWATTAPHEPPLLLMSHHCSPKPPLLPYEPPPLPMSHHCTPSSVHNYTAIQDTAHVAVTFSPHVFNVTWHVRVVELPCGRSVWDEMFMGRSVCGRHVKLSLSVTLALFPTRLLTSEDDYNWYWHQMIYFPETINTVSTLNTISPTHSLASS